MAIDKERFFTMADTFDTLAQSLVPKYDFLQEEALNLLGKETDEDMIIVDLGAGTGIFIEKILKKYANAKCYYIDFSDDFIKVAQKRLARYKGRVEYIQCSFQDDWQNRLTEKADAIFSMSAIHHLSNENKKALYQKCYSALKESGWFINIDEMKTMNHDAYVSSLYMWWEYFCDTKNTIPKEKLNYLDQWEKHFTNWKKRNIDNIDQLKTEGDDVHESFLEQINWLNEIGFKNVDVFIKYHLWCVVGGKK